jgi:hypothetical protein
VAPDQREALFGYVQLDEIVHTPPAFRLPGLDPETMYRVEAVHPTGPEWLGGEATGAALATIGLPAPARLPESVLVAHAVAI